MSYYYAYWLPPGTDTQRILVLEFRRTDGETGNVLVVDVHMRVKFAAWGVALMLGHTMAQMAGMRLNQLLPPPFSAMHAKWLRVGVAGVGPGPGVWQSVT